MSKNPARSWRDCVYPCPEGFIADALNISKKLRFLEIENVVFLIIHDNLIAAILLPNTDRVLRLLRLGSSSNLE